MLDKEKAKELADHIADINQQVQTIQHPQRY
jgi:hypothetical protein